jgi:ATP-dependent Lon protease
MSAMKALDSMAAGAAKVKGADKDSALQVTLLRQAIKRYDQELAEFLPRSDDDSDVTLRSGEYLLYKDQAMLARLEGAKKGSEKSLETEIKKTRQVGAVRRMVKAPSSADLATLSRDHPNFEPVIELMRQRASLARVTPGRVYTLPPILLAGDAGVGKTAFAEAIARSLGLPVRRVDMASNTASFVLSGSHSSWASARPGAVWALLHGSASSGVMLVDEIDKAADSNHPPLGPLYKLLEPSSAKTFMDEFVEVEIDASQLCWVATCNDPGRIEPALRSRFREFVIEAPTEAQMVAITQSVYRERRMNAPWGPVFPEQLGHGVAEAMSVCTPRELAALIEAAAAHAASCNRTSILAEDVEAARTINNRQGRQVRRLGFI